MSNPSISANGSSKVLAPRRAAVIWFKTWVESRQRFLLASTAVLLAVAWAVLNCDEAMRRFDQVPPIAFTQYVWYVYAGRFQLVWAASALFLGLGGLLRERV